MNNLELTAEITDQFVADLAAYSQDYVQEIRSALVHNAGQIAQNPMLVRLLHEYNSRKQEEQADYEKTIMNTIKYGEKFSCSNNCLTHSSSYRDVLNDLLKPYFKLEKEEATC